MYTHTHAHKCMYTFFDTCKTAAHRCRILALNATARRAAAQAACKDADVQASRLCRSFVDGIGLATAVASLDERFLASRREAYLVRVRREALELAGDVVALQQEVRTLGSFVQVRSPSVCVRASPSVCVRASPSVCVRASSLYAFNAHMSLHGFARACLCKSCSRDLTPSREPHARGYQFF
jgi:hypothetical protein